MSEEARKLIQSAQISMTDAMRVASQMYAQHAAVHSLLDQALFALGAPEPQPEPPPPQDETYRLVTTPIGWELIGIVENWDKPLTLPLLDFSGPLTSARIEMEVEIGPEGFGSTFLEFYKDSKRWKGDTILLLNRGGHGALSASHTLSGPESQPVRSSMPLKPGDVVHLIAILADGEWSAATNGSGGTNLAMPCPPITVKKSLGLQLGSHGDDSHRTNKGCKLLSFSAEVS